MRINYIAQDRSDLQFAGKELARAMQSPTHGDWTKMKRVARYVKKRPRVIIRYEKQDPCTYVEVWVDTDHAGCLRTRRSTNGGALRFGKHTLRTWSSTQAVIALSSGESEYYGIVKGASVLLGAVSLYRDLGISVKARLMTDSSAGKGIASRIGLGKVKHLHTQYLWVQERVRAKDFTLHKVSTHDNVGDLMTKYLERPKLDKFMEQLGFVIKAGRHKLIGLRATPKN